ncbi:hypothetical protein EHQ12_12050 [Leptospira gomenensis]|uniref:Uncharacterized protein n=1 Tax=Leptospira gomenensis TaxID=2484974 RepID=A0A5F1Y988_9LEPT|nr:hypothetical protein [Leptospira gomenensis]TGK32671.1 hypothetical protein EHQ17_11895 [Leptospira gomenensis]TGK36819.1 hypothetical protein EHQ12_12050 [Leptospira gomenensis]TGK39894.1 hypothetical protein EHQ07_19350 [Leptospira gomenensis]TGK58029.1 hypothetical protein EHQ13_14250 [Leptospira gomenensis]
MEPFKPKPLLNKSELRQIKKSRTRVEGQKVLTDDVKKLKSLNVTPDLPKRELVQYYKEPIWIEYYIPRESRFAYEIKYLFVKLVDPIPRPEPKDTVLREAMAKGEFVDLIDVLFSHPEKEDLIRNSYLNTFSFLESISANYKQYLKTQDAYDLRIPLFHTEALMKREPTVATLEFLGQFTIYNLNWLIRKLNEAGEEFSLEDETISMLIKRRNEFWDENSLPIDEDFELFAALFYEQAFPHRGSEFEDSAILRDGEEFRL